MTWFLVGFGVVVRLAQYLYNRSLWLDEAWLAGNVLDRSFLDLFGQLRDRQIAPLGFLMVEKLAVDSLGNSEYVLRLFPFLAGILSVFLFLFVARRVLSTQETNIALGLFVATERLIYYSSEFKQYSTDVTVALLLYFYALRFLGSSNRLLASVTLAAVGAIGIWFSQPAVFVLAGIGLTLLWDSWRRRDRKEMIGVILAGLFWVVNFGFIYFAFLSAHANRPGIISYFSPEFVPFPPLSAGDFYWYPIRFFVVLGDPLGFRLAGIAALALLIGVVQLWRSKRLHFSLLALPILATAGASAAHKYPFIGRLLLFLVPVLIIFIGAGAGYIWTRARQAAPLLGVLFLVILLLPPTLRAGYHVVRPRMVEEIRPILRSLSQHSQPEDTVYLYYSARPAYLYYEERGVFRTENLVLGKASRSRLQGYAEDVDMLRGRERVWFVFSHGWDGRGVNEEQYIVAYLQGIGTRLQEFQTKGASAYLYDLSKPAPEPP